MELDLPALPFCSALAGLWRLLLRLTLSVSEYELPVYGTGLRRDAQSVEGSSPQSRKGCQPPLFARILMSNTSLAEQYMNSTLPPLHDTHAGCR